MSATVESQYRRFLLAMASVTYLGAAVELFLVDHYHVTLQLIPFGLVAVGLAASLWAWRAPARRSLRALRWASAVVVVGSLLGVTLHGTGNVAFELEIRPNAGLGEVLWDGLSGGNPLLAPGMLTLAAVLAAAATYRHPALA